jgi:anthranilate/para-aminobenzoate synthase component I
LICGEDCWILEEDGCETARWPELSEALRTLWPRRRVRDHRPWAVGWIGYEAAARFAGSLPIRKSPDSAPAGMLLLEPDAVRTSIEVGRQPTTVHGTAKWSLDADAFRKRVAAIRERIAAGGVYQVNLCRRMTVEGWQASLGSLAAAASRGGVSDYLSRFIYDEGELLCASMELLLRRRGDRLETRPIKGTRGRGSTPAEDRKRVADLALDPKERAELAMIVDLERNDLGRVSQLGSVVVRDTGTVESYASIHHRVARLTARVRPDLEWWDVLAAMAPGGSVTGCPKIAAMSLITQLETVPRGPFTGALGVVAGDGDLEMALPIRSAWKVGSKLEFAAGCGIVWDSDPASEERESCLKHRNRTRSYGVGGVLHRRMRLRPSIPLAEARAAAC